MTKTIILAGNIKEFKDYCHIHPDIKARLVFADKNKNLNEVEAVNYEIIGTFWNRTDAADLLAIARSRVRITD